VDVDTDGPIGHVGVVLADEQTAFVSWWRRGSPRGAQLAVRSVSSDGTLGPIATVTTTESNHPDDVPQMAKVGKELLFAWTDSGAAQTVRAAVADIGGR